MVGAEGVGQLARLLERADLKSDVARALLTQLEDEVRLVSRVAQPKKKEPEA